MGAAPGIAVSSLSFSFRPPDPPRPAAELLAEIVGRGGRVYRFRDKIHVCCLTDSAELAEWLLAAGGKPAKQSSADLWEMTPGAYRRERGGKVEWDIWIHGIPVVDDDLWAAAAP